MEPATGQHRRGDRAIGSNGSLAANDSIVFRAGTHTDTMSVKYEDFARLAQPTVAEFARRL